MVWQSLSQTSRGTGLRGGKYTGLRLGVVFCYFGRGRRGGGAGRYHRPFPWDGSRELCSICEDRSRTRPSRFTLSYFLDHFFFLFLSLSFPCLFIFLLSRVHLLPFPALPCSDTASHLCTVHSFYCIICCLLVLFIVLESRCPLACQLSALSVSLDYWRIIGIGV